jgi:hypothetical protein
MQRATAKKIDAEQVREEYAKTILEVSDYYKKNRIYAFRSPNSDEDMMEKALNEKLFTPPNNPQVELLRGWLNPEKKVFTFTGSNRLGKTTIGVILSWATVMGELPWSGEKIWFPHNRARKVRYVGQGWETHIKSVVIPAMKTWYPKSRPLETKKNNQGVEALWTDKITGGTIEIMSTSQESDVFEGWEGDLVVYDEPPPRDIRIASARGLIDRQGRELIVATLLKEAWVHREIIKARDADGKPDMSVYNVSGDIYDNLGYGLTQAGIDQFIKTLKPEEKQARIYGKPSYLSTLVYPRFNRDLHVKPQFKVPLDWIVDVNIDFHPSKPWAVVFLATAGNNFKYVIHEMELRGNPKMVGEEIVRYFHSNSLRKGRIQIDPLAKGDKNNDNTVYEVLSNVLASNGMLLEVASKDKDNGIAMVNSLLWTENEMPGLFFFDDCVNTIRQVEDLMYDAESLKPTALKVDDDYTECLYRLALMDTQWYQDDYDEQPRKVINIQRNKFTGY